MQQMELLNPQTLQILQVVATAASIIFGVIFSLLGFLLKASFSDFKNEVRELRGDVSKLTNTVIVIGETGKNDHERIGKVERDLHDLKKNVTVVGLIQQRCKSCNPKE